MAVSRRERQARERAAAWNVLSLKLYEAAGAVTGAALHCGRSELPLEADLVAMRDKLWKLREVARERRGEAEAEAAEAKGEKK
jgi:hypothetical protein